jgi:UDP-N-acetylmuramoyl-tripeptide--D-alanyl-D-alanine ligase
VIARQKLEHVAGAVSPRLGARLVRLRVDRAAAHRRSLDGVVFVGVTGSSGKTTTKELIAAVLSTRLPGTKSTASWNRPSSVARTILDTTPDASFSVVEVSATFPGMVREAAGLLQPSIAVVIKIGREHYPSFRTKEATAAEKGELVAALPADGTAILNADDPHVAAMQAIAPGRVVTFGTSADATMRAEDVSSRWPERLAFTVHYDGRSFPVATRLNGKQWTSAVLAALAVGTVLDVPLEAGIEAVESFEPVPGRMSVVEDDGVTFIRDDWKAPLWTFDQVFEFVREARAARKILVIGTVSSFSDSSSRVYARLAERALTVADEVVFVGSQARHALKARTAAPGALHAFALVREAAEHIRATVREGDLVLVRGGNKVDHLLRVILARQGRVRCWREACRRQIFCDDCRLVAVPGRPSLKGRSRGS